FLDAGDPMLILDDDRAIVEANPAACTLFGIAGDDLVRRPLDELLLDGQSELVTAWRELLALGETKREHRVRTTRATPCIVECSYRARVHGQRNLCIARDVTDRRMLEARLILSENIESVCSLAVGFALYFKNLVKALLGDTALL